MKEKALLETCLNAALLLLLTVTEREGELYKEMPISNYAMQRKDFQLKRFSIRYSFKQLKAKTVPNMTESKYKS